MIKNFIAFLIAVFISLALFGQDFEEQKEYFQKQTQSCKVWMDEVGLSPNLTISELNIYENRLLLNVKLNYSAADSAVSAWNQLQSDFLLENTIPLMDILFLKFAHSYGIEYAQLRVGIRSEAVLDGLPVVDGFIYFNVQKQKIQTKGFRYRSEVADTIQFPRNRLKDELVVTKKITQDKKYQKGTRERIYQEILRQAEKYFNKRPGSVEFKRGIVQDYITFQVKNIKYEVVPDGNFFISNPHEKLDFILTIKESEGGIELESKIDGKYGSGLFWLKPSRPNNYRDMFPKYEELLKDYVSIDFPRLIESWITNY